jgi:SAM-dependent methyltransferase
MSYIERLNCVVSNKSDLEHLYTFSDFPVSMGCSNKPESTDLKFDMSWSISRSSGLIQLNKLLPLEVVYSTSHGSGTVGGLWKQHHRDFAKFISSYSPAEVLEIGGGSGILAKEFQKIREIPWTIVEPNPSPVKNCHAKFIKGFFDEHFKFEEEFDTVVHSHVFEHVYDPLEFVRHISRFMSAGKKIIFSVPNMQAMLEKNYSNCINFEHTFLLSEPYIDYLLTNSGFRIVNKQYFLEDHSIFYVGIRDEKTIPKALPLGLYEKNKELYLRYVHYYNELIIDLNMKLECASGPVYLFGAHVFAQYLIAFGLNTKNLVCILDNDEKKHQSRLCGTSLVVCSPSVLKDVFNPTVILKAGVYNEEIKKDIISRINNNVVFLE